MQESPVHTEMQSPIEVLLLLTCQHSSKLLGRTSIRNILSYDTEVGLWERA